jgi:hypothetical protein
MAAKFSLQLEAVTACRAPTGAATRRSLLVHVLGGQYANLAQVFVSEEDFVLAVGAFPKSQAGFAGQVAQLFLRKTEQQGSPAVRYVFEFLDFHLPSLEAR